MEGVVGSPAEFGDVASDLALGLSWEGKAPVLS